MAETSTALTGATSLTSASTVSPRLVATMVDEEEDDWKKGMNVSQSKKPGHWK
jgi:hypothetical protein